MAERILFQGEIDEELSERVRAAKDKFRLTNAEFLRAALEGLCDRLEAMPDPFASPIVPKSQRA